jgi:hypothetical protein
MAGNSEAALSGTPYLTHGDAASESRFDKVHARAIDVRDRALATQERISHEAEELLAPYLVAIRSDLVAESNRIEGYEWNSHQIRELVQTYMELLSGPVGSFITALRGDARVYEALGLYRAHAMADEWAATDSRPREYEIRSLHQLITADMSYAGRYKTEENKIAGSSHKTTDFWDVPRAMNELCTWWVEKSTDPSLDAAVVHAWLTHIHPFEDGNGRMARLLANLALTQAGYPPFLLRSDADRGQYYDALASSDEGDILPLYDLMVKVLRRTVRVMSSPSYAQDVVRDRLLTSQADEWAIWSQLPKQFVIALSSEIGAHGWKLELQGLPDVSSFVLLADRDPDGNSWYLKIFNPFGQARWLLWFGYHSDIVIDLLDTPARYPSVLISERDSDPSAIHPYRQVFDYDGGFPDEIIFRPLERRPVLIRSGYKIEEHTIHDAAAELSYMLTGMR